jgi:hypothetical protein
VAAAATLPVVTDPNAGARELYGASRVAAAFEQTGASADGGARVLAATRASSIFASRPGLPPFPPAETEAFHLQRSGNEWLVIGSDPSGVLYGCLDLARRIRAAHGLPASLDATEHPAFKIRGTNLFWMKSGSYDWAITPENFAWFFDRALMTRYLDQLVENRFNAIFFWTGHPFPYFLRLPRYPEARMLDEQDLQRNIEQLRWFTQEADRRGIWTVLHFYNIHVSPAFAKAHETEGVRVQNHAATPLLEAYMRHCVSEFVNNYPNVGLMLTAGEALNVKPEEFIRDAIIPGIQDTGKHPPLIVRQWTIDPYRYRDVVKPAYDNLFTMMKHNTEMLVSPHPDPRHATWISFGQSHIVNVHENSDVKPFRWGSPVFIRQMVQLWKAMGVSGFHLYPMVSWDWPVSLDRASPPLSTIDRDWIWIEAFGRYGWNPDRPADMEEQYWKERLAEHFGEAAAAAVYQYYVEAGPVLPALQNIANIYNMNFHPTAVSREATLNGILHADRWEDVGDYLPRPLDEVTLDFYRKKYGELGEAQKKLPPVSVKEWVAVRSAGKQAEGIDPIRLSALLVDMASRALAGLEAAKASRDAAEYARFVSDAQCTLYLAQFYRAKLEAATEKGLYEATSDGRHYDRMLQLLAESVSHYADLDRVASKAYRQATDLGTWFRWDTVRQNMEQELAFYREQSSVAKSGADIVYLGLDGPMNDASDAFHWEIEQARQKAGWSAQSYRLDANMLARAKVAVVYESSSPAFERLRPRIEDWVRRGGRLLIWDPMARAGAGSLTAGLEFGENGLRRVAPSSGDRIQFLPVPHPLLGDLAGSSFKVGPADRFSSSIRAASSDWQELAYAVRFTAAGGQFYNGRETFGPNWTSLMDPARVPVLLARELGSGEIVVAQLGTWTIDSRNNMDEVRKTAAESPLGRLAANLVMAWAAK